VETKQVSTDQIKPYPHNPRIITEEAITQVANSIREFGWRQPIVKDKNMVVIAGHTRLEAAKVLGLATVPVHVADLSEHRVRAYRLADNKTAETTDWEEDLLVQEIEALMDAQEIDLAGLGFVEDEINSLVEDIYTPSIPATMTISNSATGTSDVNSSDIEKTKEKLETQYAEGSKQDLIDFTCPHCGETYSVNKTILS